MGGSELGVPSLGPWGSESWKCGLDLPLSCMLLGDAPFPSYMVSSLAGSPGWPESLSGRRSTHFSGVSSRSRQVKESLIAQACTQSVKGEAGKDLWHLVINKHMNNPKPIGHSEDTPEREVHSYRSLP